MNASKFNKIFTIIIVFFIIIFFSSYSGSGNKKKNTWEKPNIIYILADDLGYGELGCFGQEKIETPHIDQLAGSGIIFTQHYSGSPVCAPSRGVLMTGKHTGHAQIRDNDEWRSRGKVWNYYAQIADSTLEGQWPLKERTETVATLLKDAGYTTGIVGKWGLGAPHTVSTPLQMGFDFFFGYNCQRQAHTYYPVHLYKNDIRTYLNNDTIPPNAKLDKDADPYNLDSYKKFNLSNYSGDIMFSELQRFITDNNPKETGKPFFMYWANPIPHLPLQAPEHWINYYVAKFGDEEPYQGNDGYFPQRYPRAAYAAMVSYMDEQVGMLVKQLKAMGIFDNTLIIFTSDNGPAFNGGTDSPWFNSGGDFSSKYGRGKGFTYEGGIRVPMVASWPEKIQPGTKTGHISAFWDVLPTFCDIVGVEIPVDTDGISFLPAMIGKEREQKEHDFLYWEFPSYGGQQAVRVGDWKGIRKNILKGNMEIELYNLSNDLSESNNIAQNYPEVVQQIEDIMKRERVPSEHDKFKIKELGDY